MFGKQKFVPALLATGAMIKINANTLPAKDWTVHSGTAKVTGEEVHSVSSQKIKGTRNIALKAETGAVFSMTNGEAEVFATDYLTGLGYKIEAPSAVRVAA